jgi:pullulanase/glycogen debranching enzyme
MIDDFTDEFRGVKAPLDAVTEKLDYLQNELGINAIVFMPWTAWPGEGYNWGYEPFQYFSVEYRYANDLNKPEEKLSYLKNLISECHQRGIHVIMDGVFNHVTGNKEFPYRRLYQNPGNCPYVGVFGGQFSGLTDLDFNNGCTQEYVRDVCLYWIDEFSIDGIRFDNTTNFFIWEDFDNDKPNPKGLPNLIKDIRDRLSDPNFSLTLEHLSLDASKVANVVRADSYWNNALYECAFEYLWHERISPKIMNALNNHKGLKSENIATTYLSNHDHSHVTWQAGARHNDGSKKWYRTQPYAIALLTCPGTPMIQNGQEFAEDYWIMEDDEGSSRRVQPRPLRWKYPYDKFGRELLWRYKKLIEIRLKYPGLRSNNFYPENWEEWQTKFNPQGYGVDVDSGIVIYHRWGDNDRGILQKFIIVLNFSSENRSVSVPFPDNGVWEDLISNWKPTVSNYRLNFEVGSNWGHVFFREG